MNKLETRKVLDVQWGIPKMPSNIKKFFFGQYDNVGNYCWVEYHVGGYEYEEDSDENEELNILDEWLLENTDVKIGEKILLKHWW